MVIAGEDGGEERETRGNVVRGKKLGARNPVAEDNIKITNAKVIGIMLLLKAGEELGKLEVKDPKKPKKKHKMNPHSTHQSPCNKMACLPRAAASQVLTHPGYARKKNLQSFTPKVVLHYSSLFFPHQLTE